MKRLFLQFALFSMFCSYSQNDERLHGIETVCNNILKATKAPGFAVAIVEGETILYSKGFGYRDYENKLPMDTETLLPIGSTTKAFTCALLGQLKAEGKLLFGDNPLEYVKELRFYTEALNKNSTIKDLMTHQTGLAGHDESWYLFPSYSKDSLVQRIQYQEPFTQLRQEWRYNNFMFMLQGVIAERITGRSWEENIAHYFFSPLDMQRSNSTILELRKKDNIALGYELYRDTLIAKVDYFDLAGMAPAGSINSTVHEMAKWLIIWLNNGIYKEKQILSASYVREALSSQVVTSPSLPEKEFPDMHLSNYGYGWFISSYRGHYRLQHEGNIDGFSTNVSFFPSDGLGIVVMTNQGSSSLTSMVRNTIADRMLKTQQFDWVHDFLKDKAKAVAEKSTHVRRANTNRNGNVEILDRMDLFTGSYTHRGYGSFTVLKENDSLFAQFKRKKYYLRHMDDLVFKPMEPTLSGLRESGLPNFSFQYKSARKDNIVRVHIALEPSLKKPIEFEKSE